ncbi:hypothetical protein M501DRAFT_436936 [Patellaria atrata CBS 101060]|uniref:Uncharacterized protein n=1 Tax=Patellaria atrata CBS 101060 TaxID=1346257 RepID=A0A9P4S5F5_9PEZI|nr:hypothetical protein M501DRAFT_436936 [Patellaria atrata CBS 101060]
MYHSNYLVLQLSTKRILLIVHLVILKPLEAQNQSKRFTECALRFRSKRPLGRKSVTRTSHPLISNTKRRRVVTSATRDRYETSSIPLPFKTELLLLRVAHHLQPNSILAIRKRPGHGRLSPPRTKTYQTPLMITIVRPGLPCNDVQGTFVLISQCLFFLSSLLSP